MKLGLIPGFGGTQRLAKIVGRNRAKEMIFTGKNINIEEALKIGLVLKAFSDKKSLMEEAIKTIKIISENSDWLQEHLDKEGYLRQKVSIKIYQKFRFSIRDKKYGVVMSVNSATTAVEE